MQVYTVHDFLDESEGQWHHRINNIDVKDSV